MVAQTRLNVALYVYYLLVYLLILRIHVADRKKKDFEPNGCIDPAVWSSYLFILLVG